MYTMASEEAIDAKLEAFENCMEEKMQSLFIEFSIGRPSSPRKSQHGETSDQRDDPQEHGHITSDLNNPCIKVDFPRWVDGKKETRSGGSRTRSAIFGSTEPPTPHGWRLLPSTLREMLFSGLIGLSTPMGDSLQEIQGRTTESLRTNQF
ncbi:hypothetical protein B296_00005699 [Ensete ventricosum]|uniref:Uncharacterized protein n=1 Tax=Ensete ventricosum TaxID=4639 RepID=A0A426XA36_ENSVE|nr:hypothetical protein B296_00005699 [Ensete ventricosum]